jgi:hypothetical protein
LSIAEGNTAVKNRYSFKDTCSVLNSFDKLSIIRSIALQKLLESSTLNNFARSDIKGADISSSLLSKVINSLKKILQDWI